MWQEEGKGKEVREEDRTELDLRFGKVRNNIDGKRRKGPAERRGTVDARGGRRGEVTRS